VGWDFVHVAIDDNSRFAFSQIRPDERASCTFTSRKAAVACERSLAVVFKRLMTNGVCYKSHDFAAACRRLKIRHIRTRPFTFQTNRKVERVIKTELREWAYARTYADCCGR